MTTPFAPSRGLYAQSVPSDVTGGMALPDAIAAIACILLGDVPFDLVLECLTDITKQTVPGAFAVSVTMHDRRPVTVAASSQFAAAVDECQYDAGDGPCLDALRLAETVVVPDQAAETRWPAYSGRAAAAGVGSSISVPLVVNYQHVAALNIYARPPHAFTAEAIGTATALAVYAAVLVSNADLYLQATARAGQMADAMASRSVIEQAKGAIMADQRCTAQDAFGILVRLSQETSRKVNVVADDLMRHWSTAGTSSTPRLPQQDGPGDEARTSGLV